MLEQNNKTAGYLLFAQAIWILFVPIRELLNVLKLNLGQKQLIFDLFVMIPVIVYLILLKRPLKETVRLKPISFGMVCLCLLVTIASDQVFSLVTAISLLFTENTTVNSFVGTTENMNAFFVILELAVIPPIAEELLYRGAFLMGLRKHNALAAILVSAFVFGAMHGNVNQFCYAIVIGFLLAIVNEATGSIVSSMVIHFFINLKGVIQIYALPYFFGYLKNLYVEAQESGDTVTMELLKNALPVEGIDIAQADANDILLNIANTSSSEVRFAAVRAYIIPAIIGGTIAFLLIRYMAKKNGRLDVLKAIFKKKEGPARVVGAEDSGSYQIETASETVQRNSFRAMLNWPLIAGTAILTLEVVLTELYMRGLLTLQLKF